MTRSPTFSPTAETTTPPQTSGPAAPRPSPLGPTSQASPWLHNHAYRRASLSTSRFPSICRCQVDGAVQLNTLFDAAFPYGGVYRYWKSSFLKELKDDMLDIMVARSAKMLSPMSSVLFFHVHGAPTRVDRNATAFGM